MLKRVSILALMALATAAPAVAAAETHTTSMFSGAKVSVGTVVHQTSGKVSTLTLSDDFKVPDTPAPHW